MPARVYVVDSTKLKELKKFVEYDPYLDNSLDEAALAKLKDDELANVIIARQTYFIKDGVALNLDRGKLYLYLSASEEFLDKAEKKLISGISGLKRETPELEKKIIETIEAEESKSDSGVGFIFG